jgi:hypothetical protein
MRAPQRRCSSVLASVSAQARANLLRLARAARQIGHARSPLVEDQVEAGTQPIPALLQRCDARVAAADL